MKRAFLASGVIATSGFLFVQFVFEGAPTLLTAMAGAAVALAAAAPVAKWLADEARDLSIERWIQVDPEAVGRTFGWTVADAIHGGDVLSPDYPRNVKAVEEMALTCRDLAAAGRDRLREVELRKAL